MSRYKNYLVGELKYSYGRKWCSSDFVGVGDCVGTGVIEAIGVGSGKGICSDTVGVGCGVTVVTLSLSTTSNGTIVARTNFFFLARISYPIESPVQRCRPTIGTPTMDRIQL